MGVLAIRDNLLKKLSMKRHNRDLLVLLKTASVSEEAFEKHVENLHYVLRQVERNDVFCKAHELVRRLGITRKARHILNAIGEVELKPFNFLINLN